MNTIGIDEVGRGAIAGPVSVGGFLVSKNTVQETEETKKSENISYTYTPFFY